MSLIELPLPTGELFVRIVLLLGLILHKVVWEVMKKGERAPRQTASINTGSLKSRLKSLVKLGKIFVLAFLVVQTIALNVLPISDQPTGLRIVGMIIYLVGLSLAITGRVQLGKNWANIEDYQVITGQSLVQSGVYRQIRHPIYTGDILLLLGLELAMNSWLVLGVIPLALYVAKQAENRRGLIGAKVTSLPGISTAHKNVHPIRVLSKDRDANENTIPLFVIFCDLSEVLKGHRTPGHRRILCFIRYHTRMGCWDDWSAGKFNASTG